MTSASLLELHALRERLSGEGLDQGHLFSGWPSSPTDYTAAHLALLRELHGLAAHYSGGVEQYIRTGRALLQVDSSGPGGYLALAQPPLLFSAPRLDTHGGPLSELEAAGAGLVARTAFVLVAGGVGERLGYAGAKVGLPVETATATTYLGHYLSWIRVLGGAGTAVVVMTSAETHAETAALLARVAPDMPNVRLLKQQTVFCFADGEAHLARGADGGLLRKPHGHGDVHSLLYAATAPDPTDPTHDIPIVQAWMKKGYRYVCFFQDTNATAVFTIPVSLAISERELLDVNFTCIPRQPKEAVGLMCRVKINEPAADGRVSTNWKTVNIEYNAFEDVARTLTEEKGDHAAVNSKYSPFPGNINTLILKLPIYAERLQASKGQVPEFINPKFTDDTRRKFKKPCRVESLMQDIALLFSEGAKDRVGGTVFSRFTYQPVKNSLEEAIGKVKQGMDPYCLCSGEADFFEFTRRRLKAVGVPLSYSSEPQIMVRSCIPVRIFPIITMDAVARGDGTLAHLAKVFPNPELVHISPMSTLLIEGKVIVLSLELKGAVKLVGPQDLSSAPLVVQDFKVKEPEWGLETILEDAESVKKVSEIDTMRGYVLVKRKCVVFDGLAKI
ncbi:unnamed protein product [Phytomonas sp. Hart1]|nr:unnamed protein product [Phytomonas sp. Hart1]|eukprot:CCW70817.1 unnamed protein product [Phytomonas sp. isolate Hart1]